MKNKVFKVIGIVLVSILAFVGAVIGVLAIMGKFKKPVVYPSQLVFQYNNFEVVNRYDLDAQPLYFVLTGVADDDNEVTEKNCVVYFVKGRELITLTDAQGTPLPEMVNENGSPIGRYVVQCNEPIYYKLKNIDEAYYLNGGDGEVQIKAVDEKGLVQSNTLSFYVDMAVEGLQLQDKNLSAEPELSSGKLNFTLDIGQKKDFAISSKPNYALKPILSQNSSRQEEKNVEIYFYYTPDEVLAPGQTPTPDYIPLKDLYSEEGPNKYGFNISKQGNTLTFESASAGTYTFILAVFDCYQNQDGNPLPTNPTNDDYYRRTQKMITQIVSFEVKNLDVDNVEVEANDVTLNLYEQTKIYLLEDSNYDNTIGLNFTNNSGENVAQRIGDVSFSMDARWDNDSIVFASADQKYRILFDAQGRVQLVDGFTTSTTSNYSINSSTLSVPGANITFRINYGDIVINGKKIIQSLTYNDGNTETTLTTSRGIAFADVNRITLLITGSYIGFYTKANSSYILANSDEFDFETSQNLIKEDSNYYFNVTAKMVPTANIYLLVLAVNSNGTFSFNKQDISVKVADNKPLSYAPLPQSTTLNVTYADGKTIYDELQFDQLVKINAGTYRTCLFVTPFSNNGNYNVDVLSNFTYQKEGTRYVVVGYLDETGAFVNNIRAKNKVNDGTTQLYILQIKNEYGETAENFVAKMLEAQTATISEDRVVSLQNGLTIKNEYEFKTESLQFNFNAGTKFESGEDCDQYCYVQNGNYYCLENTNDHTITISSTIANMLKNIYTSDFANLITIHLSTGNELQTQNYIKIVSAELGEDGDSIVITYEILSSLPAQLGEYVNFVINYNSSTITLPNIFIVKDEATDINLVVDNTPFALSNNTDSVASSLKVEIGFNAPSNNYSYKFTLVNGGTTKELDGSIVNSIFSAANSTEEGNGFKATPMYKLPTSRRELTISSLGEEFSITQGEVKINKVGSCYIKISCNNVVKYLFVEITSQNFNLSAKASPTEGSTNLSDYVEYTYSADGEPTPITGAKFFSISSLDCTSNRQYIQNPDGSLELGYTFNEVWQPVVKIVNNETDWKIELQSAFAYSNVAFNMDVYVATQANPVKVSVSFTRDIMSDYNYSAYNNIYADTTILVAELSKDGTFNNEPLIKITDKSSTTNSFTIKYDTPTQQNLELSSFSSNTQSTIQLNKGQYVFRVYLNTNTLIGTHYVNVKPNIVVGEANRASLQSETEYDIDSYISLQRYKTSPTYGLNGNLYNQQNLEKLTDYSKLQLSGSAIQQQSTRNKFTTSHINEIEKVVDSSIDLTYDGVNVGSLNITVTNKYNALIHVPQSNFNIIATLNSTLDIYILQSINGEKDASWQLSSITASDSELKFSVINEQPFTFKLDNNIGRTYTQNDVTLTITFKNDGQTLIYKTKGNLSNSNDAIFTITPFVPLNASSTQAYSGTSDFDLIKNVIDTEQAEIKSVYITNITSADTNISVADIFADTTFIGENGRGYVKGDGSQNGCLVTFNDFGNDSVQIDITYKITYTNDASYNYVHTLKISNRQEINFIYPYDFANETAIFVTTSNATDKDRQNLNNKSISISYFEPVVIGQNINFEYDELLSINRVAISNRLAENALLDLQANLKSVEIVAHQNTINLGDSMFSVSNKSITFNNLQGSNYAFFVIKVTTISNNFAYYYVRLYNKNFASSYTNVDINNVYEIGATQSSSLKFYSTSGNSASILGNNFSGSQLTYNGINYSTGLSLSQYVYNNFMLYLLNVSSTASNETGSELLHTKLNDKPVPTNVNYSTYKIALLYYDTTSGVVLNLGIIKAYVAPSAQETAHSVTELNSYNKNPSLKIKDGKYQFELSASSLANPFTYNSTIPSVKIDTALTSSIIDKSFTANESSISYAGNQVVAISSTSINRLSTFTHTELKFYVRYSYNNGFELLLLVTIKPTTIDFKPETLNAGTFDLSSEQFKKELDLTNYLSGYVGNISITNITLNGSDVADKNSINLNSSSISSGNFGSDVTYAIGNGNFNLSFDIKTNNYTLKFTLVFDNLADVSNNRKEFTINVEPGIFIISTNETIKTSIISLDYSSVTGSSIAFEFSQLSGDVYKVSIGNLKIYTHQQATLRFSARDNANYLVSNLSQVTTNNKTISFAHSAEEKSLVLGLGVLAGSQPYSSTSGNITTNLNLVVAKTYSGLKSVYLTSENADDENLETFVSASRENVKPNSQIENLRQHLFGNISTNVQDVLTGTITNKKRIALIKLDGETLSFDYGLMGLTIKNNPNFIKIEGQGALNLTENEDDYNLSILSSGLDDTYLVLSNDAGVSNIRYNYQIIDDGFNVLPSSSYLTKEETSSITLTIKDTVQDTAFIAFEEPLTVGEFKDKFNTQFHITNASLQINDTPNPTLIKTAGETYRSTRTTEDGSISYKLYFLQTDGVNWYSFTITKNADKLNVQFERIASSALFKSATLKLTFYGESGEIGNLTISLYNYEIVQPSTLNVVAGTTINIINSFKVNDYEGNASNEFTYPFIAEQSYYYYPSTSQYPVGSNNSEIFKLDVYTLTLYSLADSAKLELYFYVRFDDKDQDPSNDIYIGVIRLDVLISANFQFRVNNSDNSGSRMEISDNPDIIQTYFYYMTSVNLTEEDNTKFPYRLYLSNYKSQITDLTSITANNTTYYNNINIQLFDVANNTEIRPSNNFKIELANNVDNVTCYQSLDSIYLTISKDFTGDILLKLTAVTYPMHDNDYVRYLRISVLGFFSLKYNADNHVIESDAESSIGFTSNTEVDIFSSDINGTGIGAKVYAANNDYSFIPKIDETNKFTVKYDIADYNGNITLAELQELYSEEAATTANVTLNNGDKSFKLSTKLPYVPIAVEGQEVKNFFVIYKISIVYYNQTLETYIAYKVYNDQTIFATNTAFNADNEEELKDNNLKLFFYSVAYTLDVETQESITLTIGKQTDETADNGIVLNLTYKENAEAVGEDYSTLLSEVSGNSIIFKNKEKTKQIEIVNYASTRPQVKFANISSETLTDEKTKDVQSVNTKQNDTYVVYRTNFNDIVSYATFINQINEAYIENALSKTKTFTLIFNNDGTISINLVQHGALFNNHFNDEIQLRDSNGNALISTKIEITTQKEIKPKGHYKLADIYSNYTFNEDINVDIIGIGTPSALWCSPSGNPDNYHAELYLTTDSASHSLTYPVYKVVFTSTSTDLYTLSAEFYYISGTTSITCVDYKAGSNESNFFHVEYNPFNASVFNISNVVVKFENNSRSGAFERTSAGATIIHGETKVWDRDDSNQEFITDLVFDTTDSSSIKISNENLVAFKNSHSNIKRLNVHLSVGSFEIDVVFDLPEYRTIERSSLTSEVSISNLFADSEITAITEVNNTYLTFVKSTNLAEKSITLNTDEINRYFERQENYEHLKLTLEVTLANGNKETINIIIKNSKVSS